MIVVDTNVIAGLLLSGEQTPFAERALKKDSEWAAPFLWRSEFRNVLALYQRKNIIALNGALQIMNMALGLMRGKEYDVPSNEVLRLVSSSNCSAYDCEFVAVAKDLDVPLVTIDRQLLREFPDMAVSLRDYSGVGEI